MYGRQTLQTQNALPSMQEAREAVPIHDTQSAKRIQTPGEVSWVQDHRVL